jgi:hypothetical protein
MSFPALLPSSWKITSVAHDYPATTRAMRSEYPGLGTLPAEDRMPGAAPLGPPIPPWSPEEARAAREDPMPEAAGLDGEEAEALGSRDSRLAPRAGTFAPLDPFHAGVSLGSGYARLQNRTAVAQALSSGAVTLQGAVTTEAFDLVTASMSLGFLEPADQGGFQQIVQDEAGNVYTASSSATLGTVGIAGGLRTPDLCIVPFDRQTFAAASVFARFGYAKVDGGRHIEDCADCSMTNLAVTSGAFAEAGTHLGVRDLPGDLGVTLETAYRRYLGGALRDEVQLGLGVWYW